MPTGRPTKYKKRYCEDVIEHMKNGASFNSFAAKIEVDDSQIRRWKQKYPDFYTACQIAEKKSLEWWENFAMQSATGRLHDPAHKGKYKKHNPGMIQFIMKQRFYRDYNRQAYIDPGEQQNNFNFNLSYDPANLKDKK